MGTNLRQKQTAALNRMLNFNVQLADGEGGVINPSEWSDHVRQSVCMCPAWLLLRLSCHHATIPSSHSISIRSNPIQSDCSGRC